MKPEAWNPEFLYKKSTQVLGGQDFDVVLETSDFLKSATKWTGNVWADLTSLKPFESLLKESLLQQTSSSSTDLFEMSVERALQLIFTKFANREYSEGIFVVKAEVGRDWFTPILQQPHCILRNQLLLGSSTDYLSSISSITEDFQATACHSPPRKKRASTLPSMSSPALHFSPESPLKFTIAIFYLGENVRQFCATFYTIGLIPGINSW